VTQNGGGMLRFGAAGGYTGTIGEPSFR